MKKFLTRVNPSSEIIGEENSETPRMYVWQNLGVELGTVVEKTNKEKHFLASDKSSITNYWEIRCGFRLL
jgi:hypothetical protein